MTNIVNGRYALADPSSGLTMLSLEGGELNMFGSCTRIRTTHKESYPVIHDEPTELAIKNNVIGQLITGLAIAAVLAGVAIAVVVTGGAALAPLACALGGAAIGVGAVAIGTAINDSETGYNRSWGEYWGGLITGGCVGFMAGASVYGIIAAVPAAATAAGVQASMMLGTSTFTAIVVPNIMTIGGYSLAAASGLYAANDIYSNSRGYNIVLDKIFDNNVEAYETAGMVLDMFGEAYTSLGESNQALGNKSNNASEESGEVSSKGDRNIDDNIEAQITQKIDIKDKNNKQDTIQTDAYEELQIQNCSYNENDVINDKEKNNKFSVNLNKQEENITNKNFGDIEERKNIQKEDEHKKVNLVNEGINIEDGNNQSDYIEDLGNTSIKKDIKTIKELMSESDAASKWGVLDDGTNQGVKHFYDYWEKYPERIPSLEKRLGVKEGSFNNSLEGFVNFTTQAERVITEATSVGNIRNVNGKTIYYIDGADKPKKGVVVIVRDGKIQSMMPSDSKTFNKKQ